MMRSLVFAFTTGFAALFALATPSNVMAQYGGYLPAQPMPSQQPYDPEQPAPSIQDIAGNWLLFGNEETPCQVIPSRYGGNRAIFINEKGERATGFIRGNQIFVPRWKNLQGVFLGDTIHWFNNTVWTR